VVPSLDPDDAIKPALAGSTTKPDSADKPDQHDKIKVRLPYQARVGF
jgi:hypothetical protein